MGIFMKDLPKPKMGTVWVNKDRLRAVIELADSTFCPDCEFIRIMNPDGLGWCHEHGDIDGRGNDPRNHTGENL